MFDSLQDVLAYECDYIYTQLADNMNKLFFNSKQEFFLYLIEAWIKQEVLIKTLVENNMVSIIYNTHMKNSEWMKKIFLKDMTLSEKEADYLVSILSNIIPAAVNTWYLHGKKETPEQIYQAVSKSLSAIDRQL